jgi:hypothetical protein
MGLEKILDGGGTWNEGDGFNYFVHLDGAGGDSDYLNFTITNLLQSLLLRFPDNS